MAVGGKRQGAGRPKGSRNKRTVELIEAVEEKGKTPLQFLLDVMLDESNEIERRIDAAKSAAPYVHSRLSNVQHSGDAENPLAVAIKAVDVRFRRAGD